MGGRARDFERIDQRRAPIREPISGDPILSGGDAILPASLLGPGRIVNPTRIAIWAVNAALFVLCCWLAAGLVNTAIGEWLAGPPTETIARAPVAPPPTREWSDRQTILERNLFQVSTLLPEGPVDAAPEPSEEELEATRLPLRLLGTAANTDGGPSWAAVEDQQNHKQIVVREKDELLEQATVVRIERRRIVLQNGGKREELALDEEEPGTIKVSARPAARTAPPPAPNDLPDRIRPSRKRASKSGASRSKRRCAIPPSCSRKRASCPSTTTVRWSACNSRRSSRARSSRRSASRTATR
jgi:hypothetical protein